MNDTIIVSYDDHSNHSNDIPILIVGRKRLNESTEIINAFDGDEAKELYERLVTIKGDSNG